MLHGSTAFICNVVSRNRSMPSNSSSNYPAPSKEQLEQANKSQNALLPMQEIMTCCSVFTKKDCTRNEFSSPSTASHFTNQSLVPGYFSQVTTP